MFDKNKLKQSCLMNLNKASSDTLLQLDLLSSAPVTTLRMLGGLFNQAVNLGFAQIAKQGLADQFKVNGGYGTSIDEIIKISKHVKVMSTTIDWYADGTMAITKSDVGLNVDLNTVDGLYCYVWGACVADVHNTTFAERSERNTTLTTAAYEDSQARAAFEKLCLNCAEPREKGSEYCSDGCRTNFWKWCNKQAHKGQAATTKAFQSKINKIRHKMPSAQSYP